MITNKLMFIWFCSWQREAEQCVDAAAGDHQTTGTGRQRRRSGQVETARIAQ